MGDTDEHGKHSDVDNCVCEAQGRVAVCLVVYIQQGLDKATRTSGHKDMTALYRHRHAYDYKYNYTSSSSGYRRKRVAYHRPPPCVN